MVFLALRETSGKTCRNTSPLEDTALLESAERLGLTVAGDLGAGSARSIVTSVVDGLFLWKRVGTRIAASITTAVRGTRTCHFGAVDSGAGGVSARNCRSTAVAGEAH